MTGKGTVMPSFFSLPFTFSPTSFFKGTEKKDRKIVYFSHCYYFVELRENERRRPKEQSREKKWREEMNE